MEENVKKPVENVNEQDVQPKHVGRYVSYIMINIPEIKSYFKVIKLNLKATI
jgi:hypothetical protein